MRTLVVAVLLALIARSAAAGGWVNPYNGSVWNNPQSQLMDTIISQSTWHPIIPRDRNQNARAAANAQITATDFAPGKRRLIVQEIIDAMEADASEREMLVAEIGHVFARYEGARRKNNVAYAAAFLIQASLTVGRGQTVDDARVDKLALAVNDLLARNPAFVKATAADRQKLYETFITLGGLVLVYNAIGKDDPESAKAAKELADQGLAMFGLE